MLDLSRLTLRRLNGVIKEQYLQFLLNNVRGHIVDGNYDLCDECYDGCSGVLMILIM